MLCKGLGLGGLGIAVVLVVVVPSISFSACCIAGTFIVSNLRESFSISMAFSFIFVDSFVYSSCSNSSRSGIGIGMGEGNGTVSRLSDLDIVSPSLSPSLSLPPLEASETDSIPGSSLSSHVGGSSCTVNIFRGICSSAHARVRLEKMMEAYLVDAFAEILEIRLVLTQKP